ACVYEGTNGIQAIDLLFRKVAGDRGEALKELLGEIGAFLEKSGGAHDGAFDPELVELGRRAKEVGAVATQLAGALGSKDFVGAALGATPFLTLCGNLVGGYLLLQ